MSSEAFTAVECATDISLADLSECEAMENELNKEDSAAIDANAQSCSETCQEENQLGARQTLWAFEARESL